MDFQRESKTGRFVRGYEILSRKTVTKTASIPNTGANAGLLDEALGRTNVFHSLKDAKRYEVFIRGKNSREKHVRFKQDIHVGKNKQTQLLSNYLLWGVLNALRARGYRTQYNIDAVSFSHEEYTKAKARQKRVLHDVEIVVKVHK